MAGVLLGLSTANLLATAGITIPSIWMIVALVIIAALVATGVMRAMAHIDDYELGREGEIAVAQYLQQFERIGYRVIHDVPGERWNVDHLLIGPTGIWVLETKTWRKPERGSCQIRYDGTKLHLPDGRSTSKPIEQVERNIEWMRRLLRTKTGKPWHVRGALLFPGWLIEAGSAGRDRRIWVLNPKALSAFLQRSPRVLSGDEIREVNNAIRGYVRAFQLIHAAEKG